MKSEKTIKDIKNYVAHNNIKILHTYTDENIIKEFTKRDPNTRSEYSFNFIKKEIQLLTPLDKLLEIKYIENNISNTFIAVKLCMLLVDYNNYYDIINRENGEIVIEKLTNYLSYGVDNRNSRYLVNILNNKNTHNYFIMALNEIIMPLDHNYMNEVISYEEYLQLLFNKSAEDIVFGYTILTKKRLMGDVSIYLIMLSFPKDYEEKLNMFKVIIKEFSKLFTFEEELLEYKKSLNSSIIELNNSINFDNQNLGLIRNSPKLSEYDINLKIERIIATNEIINYIDQLVSNKD